jgi:hypothetical protein
MTAEGAAALDERHGGQETHGLLHTVFFANRPGRPRMHSAIFAVRNHSIVALRP